MIFEEVRLKNWCQFEDLHVPLGTGLIRVHGRNGSGKSNFIEAMVYLLTGKTRTEGTLADNIRQGKPQKAKSGVEGVVLHNNSRLDIKRYLSPQSQSLLLSPVSDPGLSEAFDKAGPVNQAIQNVLGIDQDMLLKYVFVEQWKIFEFLDLTSEKRAQFFSNLFNVEHAQLLHKELGDFRVDVPVPSIDIDSARSRLARAEGEIAAIREQLAALPADEWSEANDPDTKLLSQWREKQRLQEEITRDESQFNLVTNSLAELAASSSGLAEDVQAVEALGREQAPLLEQVRNDMARWTAARAVLSNLGVLTKRLEQVEGQRKDLQAPREPADYMQQNGPEMQELVRLRVELNQIEKFLKDFNPDNHLTECPTCGTPTSALADKIQQFQEKRLALAEQLGILGLRNDRSRKYDTDGRDYAREVRRLDEQAASLRQQLQALKPAEPPSRSEVELRQLKEEYEEVALGLGELRKQYAEVSGKLAQAQGRHTTLKGMLDAKRSRLSTLAVSAEEADLAGHRLEYVRECHARRDRLRVRLEVLERSAQDDRIALTQAQEAIEQAGQARALQTHLQEARAVFHRDRLQRRVSQAKLETLNREVNENLDRFDAPFRAQLQDDLSYKMLFRNGNQTRAGRLSGGQKATFAIAFRLAVNSRYARDLGLLVLDEPTAGLDEGNLACLEVALTRLGELSRSRGLQVILITHERLLDNLFDRVVELPSQR